MPGCASEATLTRTVTLSVHTGTAVLLAGPSTVDRSWRSFLSYYYMRILSASAVLGVLNGVPYGTRPIRPIL